MNVDFDIRPLILTLTRHRDALTKMLERNGLRLDQLDVYYGVFDSDDELVGGAGAKGNVIKCVALDEKCRDAALTNTLISKLRTDIIAAGYSNIFVFTKPENERLFTSLAFHTVGYAQKAIMLESNPRGIKEYKNYLNQFCENTINGIIVMNCNPLTLGHVHLISEASKQVDKLFIVPVRQENGEYSYAERIEILSETFVNTDNIKILDGSPYQISAATFPSYFIKEAGDAAKACIQLDLDIFVKHIAPALNIAVRFAGTEPIDPLTAQYNDMMRSILPEHNIKFVEIERKKDGNTPISASNVRHALNNADFTAIQNTIPLASCRFALAHLAADALQKELNLTPKPGLIDTHDNGAHKDMDHDLMCKSIHAVKEGLAQFIKFSESDLHNPPSKERGLKAEKMMFEATNGINTHKGALFSMGMTLRAAMALIASNNEITTTNLQQETAYQANSYQQPPKGSHGAIVSGQYSVKGAYQTACDGYQQLYDSWLPYFREHREEPFNEHKTLLKIISELDDTNVLHRGGKEGAEWLKMRAHEVFLNYSNEEMTLLNTECIAKNISPGGAADMLALTILIDSITKKI